MMYKEVKFMKKSSEFFREHAVKIINLKKEKMKLSTQQQQESYENAKICYISKEKFKNKYLKDKNYRKVRDHGHYTGECRGATDTISNLKHSVPKKNSYSFAIMNQTVIIISS